MSDPYVRLRRGGGALGMEGAKATGGVELGRTAPRMNTHDVTFSVLTIHGIEEVEPVGCLPCENGPLTAAQRSHRLGCAGCARWRPAACSC